jgi:nucleotide-binding universal stress UspA family protein
MSDSFYASQPYVTVAVAFDQHSEALTRAAFELAERAGKKVCLVHAVEPWTELARSRPLGSRSPLWDSMQAVETSVQDKAVQRLDALARTAPAGLAVRTSVVRGSPTRAIADEAVEIGTYLLLVGAKSDAHKIFPAGVSTGLALLAASPVPTLVVDATRHVPRFDERSRALRIVLADDLTERSEASLAYAAELARGCRGAWIHHVFVSGIARDALQVALQNAATATRTVCSDFEANEVFVELRRHQLATLEERFSAFRDYHEGAGGKYTNEVVAGGVAPELGAIVEDMGPDVLVFGRHRFVHTAPFAFGRMPFRAMLAFGRPVIVVPTP